MDLDSLVAGRVARWEEARERGRRLSVEEVCADAPHLADGVRAALRRLRYDPDETSTPARSGDTSADTPASTADDPAPPAAVGGMRVVRELGRGGMGWVLEAEDPALHRRVAVKVMLPGVAASPVARGRFVREARAQAAVEHEHVAVIHAVGEDAGAPYLVMPLLKGESLATRLARENGRPLPVPEVLRIGQQVAEGLAAAHAVGLMHRDVKPGNVWLAGEQGTVKVLDFGLARAVDVPDDGKLSHSGAVLGTPAYMAPEQAAGDPVDHRADLFSLGCVLYELTTGSKPFAGGSIMAILHALATATPKPVRELNPTVPVPLADLISRLLTKNPAERTPRTAAEVAAALRAIEAAGATTATPQPPPPKPARRRRLLVASGVGVVALVAALLVSVRTCNPVMAPTTPTAPGQATPPVKYTGSVDILVRRDLDDGGIETLRLHDPRAMPLKPGAMFVIEATIQPAAYLYLFWFDETGQLHPMYPWKPLSWDTRPATEQTRTELTLYDPDGNRWKVGGTTAGMETILMIARPDPLPNTDGQIREWFAGLKPLPFRGEKARIWFEDFDILKADAKRAPEFGGPLADSDPAAQQQLLRKRIGHSATFSRAITFARLGNQPADTNK